jgi:hypothetical protein
LEIYVSKALLAILISVPILTIAVAILVIGTRLLSELGSHRSILKGMEARLKGLEDTVIRIEKQGSSRILSGIPRKSAPQVNLSEMEAKEESSLR